MNGKKNWISNLTYFTFKFQQLWSIMLYIPITKADGKSCVVCVQAAVTLRLNSELVVSQDFVHTVVNFN